MQTYIPGKDVALEDTLSHFQQRLAQLGFDIEEVSWLNPVVNVWSVHIRDKNCPLCFTNGKGNSPKAALASALGEFFERLATNYFFADFYLGNSLAASDFVHYPQERWFAIPEDGQLPDGLLDEHLLNIYDPNDELLADDLVDLQSSKRERGICTLPFTRLSDQTTVYVPVNILGNLYVSNGMAAGNTHAEARVQALAEIVERHVKNKIIAEGIALPTIPTEVLNRYPTVQTAIVQLEAAGFPVLTYDASLGGAYPVICVVLFNPENSSCFASFGAHPDFGIALERTVTELLQGRELNQLDVFSPPTFANDQVAEPTNLETHFIDSSGLISWDLFSQQTDFKFVDWSFNGTTEQELEKLISLFHQQQAEVYIADYEHLGVYTCRIIVPGFSEIYLPEDLIIANNNMAIDLRDTILTLPSSQWEKEDYLTLLEEFDTEGLNDFTRVRELLGIACQADSPWATLRVGELKALLALAGGNFTLAEEWVSWTLDVNQQNFPAQRLRFYACLQTLLSLKNDTTPRQLEDYLPAFYKLYGISLVDNAIAHLHGKHRFYDLITIGSDMEKLPLHQQLLGIYQKIQMVKAEYFANP